MFCKKNTKNASKSKMDSDSISFIVILFLIIFYLILGCSMLKEVYNVSIEENTQQLAGDTPAYPEVVGDNDSDQQQQQQQQQIADVDVEVNISNPNEPTDINPDNNLNNV